MGPGTPGLPLDCLLPRCLMWASCVSSLCLTFCTDDCHTTAPLRGVMRGSALPTGAQRPTLGCPHPQALVQRSSSVGYFRGRGRALWACPALRSHQLPLQPPESAACLIPHLPTFDLLISGQGSPAKSIPGSWLLQGEQTAGHPCPLGFLLPCAVGVARTPAEALGPGNSLVPREGAVWRERGHGKGLATGLPLGMAPWARQTGRLPSASSLALAPHVQS